MAEILVTRASWADGPTVSLWGDDVTWRPTHLTIDNPDKGTIFVELSVGGRTRTFALNPAKIPAGPSDWQIPNVFAQRVNLDPTGPGTDLEVRFNFLRA